MKNLIVRLSILLKLLMVTIVVAISLYVPVSQSALSDWDYKNAPYNPWEGAPIGWFKTPRGVLLNEEEHLNELVKYYNYYNKDMAIGCYRTRNRVIRCPANER